MGEISFCVRSVYALLRTFIWCSRSQVQSSCRIQKTSKVNWVLGLHRCFPHPCVLSFWNGPPGLVVHFLIVHFLVMQFCIPLLPFHTQPDQAYMHHAFLHSLSTHNLIMHTCTMHSSTPCLFILTLTSPPLPSKDQRKVHYTNKMQRGPPNTVYLPYIFTVQYTNKCREARPTPYIYRIYSRCTTQTNAERPGQHRIFTVYIHGPGRPYMYTNTSCHIHINTLTYSVHRMPGPKPAWPPPHMLHTTPTALPITSTAAAAAAAPLSSPTSLATAATALATTYPFATEPCRCVCVCVCVWQCVAVCGSVWQYVCVSVCVIAYVLCM
jgi:hypothetical protein